MLFAHIAPALAARTITGKAPLGVLLFASLVPDILCGFFTAAGVELFLPDGSSSFPWSHGLFMSVVWSALAFAVSFSASRDRPASFLVGLVVFSHWILDFISHPMGMGRKLPPDLPVLFEGSPKIGLGLYTYVAAAIPVEFGLFALGIFIYLGKSRPIDMTGKWIFALVPILLVAVAALSTLPPRYFFIAGAVALLFIPAGALVDRHRSVSSVRTGTPGVKNG